MKSKKEKIALVISYVFHPVWIPALLIYLFRNDSIDNYENLDTFRVFTAITTIILPSLFVFIYSKFGKVSSIYLTERKERRVVYLVTILIYVLIIFFLIFFRYHEGMVQLIFSISLVTVNLFIVWLINFFSRISIHLFGWGGMTGLMFPAIIAKSSRSEEEIILFWGFIAVSVIVLNARYALKAHTLKELWLGFGIGFFLVLIELVLIFSQASQHFI